MINNLKKIKEEKSSNSIFENGEKNQIMNAMTQEIMNNYKKKIQN